MAIHKILDRQNEHSWHPFLIHHLLLSSLHLFSLTFTSLPPFPKNLIIMLFSFSIHPFLFHYLLLPFPILPHELAFFPTLSLSLSLFCLPLFLSSSLTTFSFAVSESSGLRILMLDVPSPTIVGESVELTCSYELEGDKLYSVKWSVFHQSSLSLPSLFLSSFFPIYLLFLGLRKIDIFRNRRELFNFSQLIFAVRILFSRRWIEIFLIQLVSWLNSIKLLDIWGFSACLSNFLG